MFFPNIYLPQSVVIASFTEEKQTNQPKPKRQTHLKFMKLNVKTWLVVGLLQVKFSKTWGNLVFEAGPLLTLTD